MDRLELGISFRTYLTSEEVEELQMLDQTSDEFPEKMWQIFEEDPSFFEAFYDAVMKTLPKLSALEKLAKCAE